MIATLKRCLKTSGLTYAALGKAVGLSEAGVKKAFADESLSLKRVEQICSVMGMGIADLVRASSAGDRDASPRLSLEQEAALAGDENLFVFFYLVASGLTVARIAERFRFTEADAERHLLTLDRLDLIELHPRGKFRCRKPVDFEWSAGGPLKARYDAAVKRDFLAAGFDGPNETLGLVAGGLTPASARIMTRKIQKLMAEFKELVELDRSAGRGQARGTWFLAAMRPWLFSVVEAYRRK